MAIRSRSIALSFLFLKHNLFVFFNILIQRRPADSYQLGKISGRNIPIFPHRIVFLNACRYLPRWSAYRFAGPGTVKLCLSYALADPLHSQLVFHFGHGAQVGQHELEHVVIVAGIKAFLDEVNSNILVFKLLDNLP